MKKTINPLIFQKGFTIVELIVAMSLFVVLISIAVGAFININRNQRIIVALMAANDNMGLTLEQMAREIRTGYNFFEISKEKIQFVNAKDQVIRYRLNNASSSIEKGISSISGPGSGDCSDAADSWFTYQPLSADNVKITILNMQICGKNLDTNILLDNCGSGDTSYPPRITLGLSITSNEPIVKKSGISINIQTTVSSRRIE